MAVRNLFRSTSASLINNNQRDQSSGISPMVHAVEIGSSLTSSDYIPTKTVSCENISVITEVKSSFPHAFLRSRPPRAGVPSRPPSAQIPSSDQTMRTPSSYRKSNNTDMYEDTKQTLRQKLKAVSEENFPMTWLRRNQTSMKMRLHSHYPQSRNRTSSTQSVNCEMIVYHSPHAPVTNKTLSLANENREQSTLPGNRSSLYVSSTDSDYNCDETRQNATRQKSRKVDSDVDSGVSSTGSHSETNSDSGSLTGNDISFDHCSKGDSASLNSATTNKRNHDKKLKVTNNSDSEVGFCKCSPSLNETSQLNLTDEEKLVPIMPEDIHPRLPEPANITSLRHKFLVSQLSRQSRCSTPLIKKEDINGKSDSKNISQWLGRGNTSRNGERSSGKMLPEMCSRPPMSLPLSLPMSLPSSSQVTPPRTYRMMRLAKDASGELGIYITAKKNSEGNTTGYVIAHIEAGGLTDRFVAVAE